MFNVLKKVFPARFEAVEIVPPEPVRELTLPPLPPDPVPEEVCKDPSDSVMAEVRKGPSVATSSVRLLYSRILLSTIRECAEVNSEGEIVLRESLPCKSLADMAAISKTIRS